MTATFADSIPTLVEKTKQGKLAWEPIVSNLYTAKVGSLNVVVSDEAGEIRVTLRNEGGDALESISDSEALPGLRKTLRQLAKMARRSALEVDAKLEEYQRSLERI